MEDDVLIADGDDAVRGWFLNSKKVAGAIGGIRDFRLGFGTLKSELERMTVPFKCGTSEFATGYETAVDILVPRLEEFFAAAQGTEKSASVLLNGYASSDGNEQVNSRLRNQRADKVRSELLSKSPELVKFGNRINVAVGANRTECAVGFEVKTP
jgi:outer membrane protein OmpA-like peptidoglycan-associated protein